MKIKYILFACFVWLINACNSSDDPTPTPPDVPGEERTVLVYWIADNGSSDLSSYTLSDFNEIIEGMAQVDVTKYNMVVYSETKQDVPRLIHIKKNNGKVVADTLITYPEQNPLSTTVMKNVFSTVVEKFPANSYGLVFASHADGWVPASTSANPRHMGDYRGSQMDITDFHSVLKEMPHLDFLLFDACYMQSVEVVYELRDCVDYIISSPTEIPGPGAPYQKIVPFMFGDTENVAINIGRGYYEYYGKENGDIVKDATYVNNGVQVKWDLGVAISVIETAKLDDLAEITNDILSRYLDSKEIVDTSSLFYYGRNSGNNIFRYYDFDELIRQITGGNQDYTTWRSAFDAVQVYFKTTKTVYIDRGIYPFSMDGAQGVYMFIPYNDTTKEHIYYQTLAWYKDGGWKSVGW